MSSRDLKLSNRRGIEGAKPLGRVQLYLVELKTVLVLLREVLVEVKELAVVAAIIYIFILGVLDLIHRMHPPP